MMTRRFFLLTAGSAAVLSAQREESTAPQPEFVCPMDPDVKSAVPGKCPRCGMPMVARILEPQFYGLEMWFAPAMVTPGARVELAFRILRPGLASEINTPVRDWVKDFEIVHEKPCHLFVVSQDLGWFVHDHPTLSSDGVFRLPITFPTNGIYAVFVDLFPQGGTPQWLPQFLFAGDSARTPLRLPAVKPNPSSLTDGEVTVHVRLDPAQPFVGQRVILYCAVSPPGALEPWLGTYAHALWVSHDLLDAEHTHPLTANGDLTFQAYFPRSGNYRFWMQFQRKGKLHTTFLDIPVAG